MTEYDIEELKQMTVARYLELRDSDNEDDNDMAYDAIANISLYLYSNTECVSDLEIEEADIDNDMNFIMSTKFRAMYEDYPIIQCDADDFISKDIEIKFDDIIDLEVTEDMTFMDIAEKMKDEIEATAERKLDHAAEDAAENYGPHRSYWWSR